MRVFGVKRVQDERSMENKMPSREFFSRFPSLHSFLLEELDQSHEQYVTIQVIHVYTATTLFYTTSTHVLLYCI